MKHNEISYIREQYLENKKFTYAHISIKYKWGSQIGKC